MFKNKFFSFTEVIIVITLCYGCSTTTSNSNSPQPISAGNFLGTWQQGSDHLTCTASVTRADTLLEATIQNDSTKESLSLTGHSIIPIDNPSPNHYFLVKDSSNSFNDTDVVAAGLNGFHFDSDGNNFYLLINRGTEQINITCHRK